jgi:hypothetical protein
MLGLRSETGATRRAAERWFAHDRGRRDLPVGRCSAAAPARARGSRDGNEITASDRVCFISTSSPGVHFPFGSFENLIARPANIIALEKSINYTTAVQVSDCRGIW